MNTIIPLLAGLRITSVRLHVSAINSSPCCVIEVNEESVREF
jgi:hypothetical protein